MTPRTIGSLFAGIGGFDLAAHAHGLTTTFTVEWADFPHGVLGRRFPGVEHLRDVRDVAHPPRVDVLTGGFPCQDLSLAGRGHGISGSRSGLWTEYARIIGEVRPELVLIENVPALLHRGMELVVENLTELGYNIEWDCLPAAKFGAPHLRDRVWIAAHHHPEPIIFGQPAALFALEPAGAAAIVGGDDDDDELGSTASAWMRWPRAGWVNGDPLLVMPLEPLARLATFKRGAHTGLLPTPSAAPAGGIANPVDRDGNPPSGFNQRWYHPDTGRLVQKDLAHAVAMLPTPVGSDAVGARNLTRPRRRPDDHIPTPNARDGGGGSSDARKRREDGRQINLRDHVREAAGLADPVAYADARANGASGALNPDWVEWLMGFPIGWTDPRVDTADLRYHTWADGEPADVPRTSTDATHRRDRLTALGNALIPPAPNWLLARYLAVRTGAA